MFLLLDLLYTIHSTHTPNTPHTPHTPHPLPTQPQGKACNVAKAEQVRALADYAQQQFGTIDLWWVWLPVLLVLLVLVLPVCHETVCRLLPVCLCCSCRTAVVRLSVYKSLKPTHTHTQPQHTNRINNAGTNAYKYGPLLESDDEDLEAIVDTNVLGVMLCCKEVRAWLVNVNGSREVLLCT